MSKDNFLSFWYDSPELHEICLCNECHQNNEHLKETKQWMWWGCELCEEQLYLADYELWKILTKSTAS